MMSVLLSVHPSRLSVEVSCYPFVSPSFSAFICLPLSTSGAWDSAAGKAPDSWSKGLRVQILTDGWDKWMKGKTKAGRSSRRIFFSRVNFLCLLLFSAHFTPSPLSRITAVANKRPQTFCQKCRWQVTAKHASLLDPVKSQWADYAVQA